MDIDWATATVRVSAVMQCTATAERQEFDLPIAALLSAVVPPDDAALVAEALFAASGRAVERGEWDEADRLAKLCHPFALIADHGAEAHAPKDNDGRQETP